MDDESTKNLQRPMTAEMSLDMDMVNTLSWIELVLALHDVKALNKQVVADRLKKLANRQDLKMNNTVRTVLRMNAKGIEASGAVDE